MAFIESAIISSYEEQRRRERFPMPLDLNPKLISDSAILLLYCAWPKELQYYWTLIPWRCDRFRAHLSSQSLALNGTELSGDCVIENAKSCYWYCFCRTLWNLPCKMKHFDFEGPLLSCEIHSSKSVEVQFWFLIKNHTHQCQFRSELYNSCG